ncbi:MAG: DMT family transporter [Lachnospiraceae bacterium]|nr:DMT family transporter [Lachnospiraceae bacterium]
MNQTEQKAKLTVIFSMTIFGTIGIFRRYITLPSGMLAMFRGYIGTAFLITYIMLTKREIVWEGIKRKIFNLLISGALIGFNWILLFEAYQHTSVAIATLCYYMAPIFVMVFSPVILKERLTGKKIVCVIIALSGMVLVSGVLKTGVSGVGELLGILLGLGAAVLYAIVILMNQSVKEIPAYDKTIVQLGSAAVVVTPYVFLAEDFQSVVITPFLIGMVLIVGIIHTGIAYALYFGGMSKLKAQTVALFSYMDPIVAILLSALFLKEPMGIGEAVGAMLVLGATKVSEFPEKRH